MAAVDVLAGAREQDRVAAGPAVETALALVADGVDEFGVDRHQRVAVHLVVEVAQVGGAVGVGGDAVAAQPQRVGDPQSAAHQDDGDQPVGRVVEPVEVGRVVRAGSSRARPAPAAAVRCGSGSPRRRTSRWREVLVSQRCWRIAVKNPFSRPMWLPRRCG